MQALMRQGCKTAIRPSGHTVGPSFNANNDGAIAPNLIALANTESNSHYLKQCREKGIKAHPARFPTAIPEYFIRLTTDPGETVLDPFAGSCTTGEAAEKLERKWICVETMNEYIEGAKMRFETQERDNEKTTKGKTYTIRAPGSLWRNIDQRCEAPLPADGGQKRKTKGEKG